MTTQADKKRSDKDIYDNFHEEIRKTRLSATDFLHILITYRPKNKSNYEKRFMFYNFKDCETFKALVYDKLESDLSGSAIRATELKILIEDQEDAYGAILYHAMSTEDQIMNVYLTDTGYPYE